jgi:hypothetical protein
MTSRWRCWSGSSVAYPRLGTRTAASIRRRRGVALLAYDSFPNHPNNVPSHRLMPNQCVESATFRDRFGDTKSIDSTHLTVSNSSLGLALENLHGVDGAIHEIVLG